MILIAGILLACFPPGILFPPMAVRMSAPRQSKKADKSDTERQSQHKAPESQGQVASGDESGLAEPQATEKPAAVSLSEDSKN